VDHVTSGETSDEPSTPPTAAMALPPLIGEATPEPFGSPPPQWRPGDSWPMVGDVANRVPASPWVEAPAPALVARVTPPAPALEPTLEQRRAWPVVLVGLGAGVLGSAITFAGLITAGVFDDDPAAVVPAPIQQVVREIVPGEQGVTPAAAVALKVVPSIVTVEVGQGAVDDFLTVASGSGVVLSAAGEIVTNNHVVEDADRLRVIFQDGRIYPAEIVGRDALTDLAVIDIDADGLTPIELGATETLVIGDTAIAVGNPLGLSGGASLTVGVVSAFGREVQVGPQPTDRLFGMLQTDAPITRGSSGGALVDALGRLIGITTAIGVSDAGAEGVGFATPVELVTRIADELIERGTVSHAFLGVELRDVLDQDGSASVPAGANIVSVQTGSAAEADGLLTGDRIVAIDGEQVLTNQDVINTLRLYRVGDAVDVEILREGDRLVVEVSLRERPEGT
jgi:S1-C subfamily serine protease